MPRSADHPEHVSIARPIPIRGYGRGATLGPLVPAGCELMTLAWARQQLATQRELGPVTLHFTDHHGGEAHCRLQVFAPAPDVPAALLVVTEHHDNPGPSVTSCSVELAQQLTEALAIRGAFCFVEVYDDRDRVAYQLSGMPALRASSVSFVWEPRRQVLVQPQWHSLSFPLEAGTQTALPVAVRNLDAWIRRSARAPAAEVA